MGPGLRGDRRSPRSRRSGAWRWRPGDAGRNARDPLGCPRVHLGPRALRRSERGRRRLIHRRCAIYERSRSRLARPGARDLWFDNDGTNASCSVTGGGVTLLGWRKDGRGRSSSHLRQSGGSAAWGSRMPIASRAAIEELREHGPRLGRPRAASISGSRHHNMKELRSAGGHLRALFAFDPRRHAVILLGGHKTNDWKGGCLMDAEDRLEPVRRRREVSETALDDAFEASEVSGRRSAADDECTSTRSLAMSPRSGVTSRSRRCSPTRRSRCCESPPRREAQPNSTPCASGSSSE